MKSQCLLYALLPFVFACSTSGNSNNIEDHWTEIQEIHLYKDCKDKMLAKGESEKNSHNYCECILLKVKSRFKDGKQAMQNISDEMISEIEQKCTVELTR